MNKKRTFIHVLNIPDPTYAKRGVTTPAKFAEIPPKPNPIVRTGVGYDSPDKRRPAERALAIPIVAERHPITVQVVNVGSARGKTRNRMDRAARNRAEKVMDANIERRRPILRKM